MLQTEEKLEQTRAQLKAQINGLRAALADLDKDIEAQRQSRRHLRGSVKAALLDLLRECGDTGLNAQTAVRLGAKRGLRLDRATMSSLLSRFKRDGIVDHDGYRYRLRSGAACR